MSKFIVKQKGGDLVITLIRSRKKFFLFGKILVFKRTFRGSGTVWHEVPHAWRCTTSQEKELSEIARYYEWNK